MKIRKIIACVLYSFVHSHSRDYMVDCFKIRASTIQKYVDIVCDIFTSEDKLFSHYINIPSEDHLLSTIQDVGYTTTMRA